MPLRWILGIIMLTAATLPAAAESMVLRSLLDQRYVSEVTRRGGGPVLAASGSRPDAVRFEVERLSGKRVALRHARSGRYLRAGIGPDGLLAFSSQSVGLPETFEMLPAWRGHALRSVATDLFVSTGRGGASYLSMDERREGAQQSFMLLRAQAAEPPPATVRPPDTAARGFRDLAGRYRIMRMRIAGEGRATALPRDAARASEVIIGTDGRIGIRVGCNSIGAQLSHTGNALTSAPAVSTQMGCPPAQARLERSIAQVLQEVRFLGADGRDKLMFLDHGRAELWTLERVR